MCMSSSCCVARYVELMRRVARPVGRPDTGLTDERSFGII